MRLVLLVGWLLIPVVLVAIHYGPGQEQMVLDEVGQAVASAKAHFAAEEWAAAVEQFDRALTLLPAERTEVSQRLRLERSKARMHAKQLSVANEELQTLVAELKDDAKADKNLLAEARSAYANSQYYLTWLMRLEGLTRDVWEPEIEAARQTYRLLAEESHAAGDAVSAKKHREDLESSIRLARMDLSELQGLPLPSQ
jgi:Skp family chaperone for outer membrane proteins